MVHAKNVLNLNRISKMGLFRLIECEKRPLQEFEFLRQKYQYGYLNEKLKTFFDVKNSSEIFA